MRIGIGRLIGSALVALFVAAAPAAAATQGDVTKAERELGRAHVVERVEAALGKDFGGAWFDPATAKLHIGVTSVPDREVVEVLVAQAGVAALVTETAVRSTREQLVAVQSAWNERITDLLASGDAATGLTPQRNSVRVQLSSSVSPARREGLEQAARSAAASVDVVAVKRAGLRAQTTAQCVKFKANEAFCDSPFVAGVSIVDKGGFRCTAGPAVVEVEPDDTTETFLLTAGHCMVLGGGIGETWYAFNKAGEKKEIGVAVEGMWGLAADVGIIRIDRPGYWAQNNLFPVPPKYAEWSAASESNPTHVTGQWQSAVGEESCISGQTTGTHCGKILAENQTQTFNGGGGKKAEVEGLTELSLKANVGDSGGPMVKKTAPGQMEGTEVGGFIEAEIFYFQPLEVSFASLETELELLTELSEERARCPMVLEECFIHAAKYPAAFTGKGVGSEEFILEAGAVVCSETHFAGNTEDGDRLHPTYSGCKAFGFLSATVNSETCDFVLHKTSKVSTDVYNASTDIDCPAGKSIKITASTCAVEFKDQNGLTNLQVTNSTGTNDITLLPGVQGIAYTVTNDGFLCPFNGTGTKSGGEFKSSKGTTISASTTEGPVSLQVD